MQRVLEQEMPVDKKRRKWPFIWLFLLLLTALSSGWAGYWFSNKYNHPLQPRKAAQEPVAQLRTPAESTAQGSILSLATHIQGGLASIATKNQNTEASNALDNNDRTTSYSPAKDGLIGAEFATTTLPATVIAVPQMMKVMDPIKVPVPVIALDAAATAIPKKVNPEAAGSFIKLLTPHRNRRLVFGPSLGIFTERFGTLNGASIGGVLDYRPSHKWGLTTSLYYSYLRPSPSTRPVASLSAVNYANATGNLSLLDSYGRLVDPQTGLSTASNKVYVPLERLDRFEMPVLGYLQFFRRLRCFFGPTLSYTQSAQVDKVYALNQVVFQATDRSNDKAVNSLASNEIKRWQLGLQTGLGMRLGDHFELDIFYRVNSIRTYNRVLYQYNGSFLEYAPERSGQINNSSIFTLNGTLFF